MRADTAPLTLDPSNDVHRRAIARLESERIAWFTSIGRRGFPHAVPVWFLWHEGEVIVLSEPNTVKVRNIARSPLVAVHLEAGSHEEQLTVVQGIAEIDAAPAIDWLDRIATPYLAKYADSMPPLSMESMATQYSTIIRVTPHRLIAW